MFTPQSELELILNEYKDQFVSIALIGGATPYLDITTTTGYHHITVSEDGWFYVDAPTHKVPTFEALMLRDDGFAQSFADELARRFQ